MFPRRSLPPYAFSLPFLNPADPPGNPNPDPEVKPGDPKPNDPPEVKFDDVQQKKVNDLLASERKATEDRVKAALAAEAEEAKKKADADREREEATKRGEFDTVKASLEKERDDVAGERDRYKAENETYAAIFEKDYADQVKELPEEVWAELKPADGAPLAERISALKKAQKIAGFVGTPVIKVGNPPNPRPHTGGPDPADDKQAKARMRPRL